MSDSLCPNGLDSYSFFANKPFDDNYNTTGIYIEKCNNDTSSVPC